MSIIDAALWRDIMGYLRERHPAICRQWFEELSPLGLDGGLLQVLTANSVQQNYLQRKCLEPFTEAAQAVTGALVAVQFVDPDAVGHDGGGGVGVGGGGGDGGGGDASGVSSNGHQTAASMNGHAHHTGQVRQGHDGAGGMRTRGGDVRGGGGGGDGVGVGGGVGGGGSGWGGVGGGLSAGTLGGEGDEILLSPDFSFSNFVTGPGNQLAHAASIAVANNPGHAYNPLFIHGGVGLGKTHLLQAISQTILRDNPRAEICYLSCDTFINRFIEAVQGGKMADFRHRYRHVDMLVIDDIHFLSDHDRTQEEFFHTFNELYQSKKQIVISSDSPPAEIPELEERLVSRFQWGLVATVSKPSYETRLAIVRAKVALRGIEMPDAVVNYIANRVDTNARELEGAITTIQGHASLQSKEITLELARESLGDTSDPNAPGLGGEQGGGGGAVTQTSLQEIIDAVTVFYNVKLSDLQSKRRYKSITEPRQVCMWLARQRTRYSLQEIGGYFGGRDHTTVMHSIRMVAERMEEDTVYASQVAHLNELLAGPVRLGGVGGVGGVGGEG